MGNVIYGAGEPEGPRQYLARVFPGAVTANELIAAGAPAIPALEAAIELLVDHPSPDLSPEELAAYLTAIARVGDQAASTVIIGIRPADRTKR